MMPEYDFKMSVTQFLLFPNKLWGRDYVTTDTPERAAWHLPQDPPSLTHVHVGDGAVGPKGQGALYSKGRSKAQSTDFKAEDSSEH